MRIEVCLHTELLVFRRIVVHDNVTIQPFQYDCHRKTFFFAGTVVGIGSVHIDAMRRVWPW